ncbi:MAG TPA: SgcJ/EcaC family oxidoreductase [Pyrinomonadaceae bacterium]|nr:SgcJ/EcaC family oxidoreductase [Pyrinomonadaceae bacterium]
MGNIRDAITSAIQTFADAFGRGDAAAVAAWYTADATLLPPDNPLVKGREAIRAFWQGAMSTGVREAKLETLEVESRDDLAYEVGRFEMAVQPPGGERAEMAGKYVVVWKREGDGWRMHVDIWNGDRAA